MELPLCWQHCQQVSTHSPAKGGGATMHGVSCAAHLSVHSTTKAKAQHICVVGWLYEMQTAHHLHPLCELRRCA
jgi:hypothetical protein